MLKRLRFLIASGPTREPMDPVRFLSNYSTGVMGRELFKTARARRHRVTFVESPRDAQTARDLQRKLRGLLPESDVLVMAAAVCDARPARISRTKIGKKSLSTLRLVKNPDILADLARKKKKTQVFVGFGLESRNILEGGLRKLERKGLDLIVLQKVVKNRTPFGEKKVDAHLLRKDGTNRRFRSISKRQLAGVVVSEAERVFRVKSGDVA